MRRGTRGARGWLVLLASLAACQGPRTDPEAELADLGRWLDGDYRGTRQESRAADTSAEAADPGNALWWRRFDDPELAALVELAVNRNLDLRGARALVREAEARLAAAHGLRLPTVEIGFDAGRSFSPIALPGFTPQGPIQRGYFTDLRPAGTVAWQADLFGRLAAGERAGLAEFQARETDRDAIAHSLIAAVVRGYVTRSVAERRLELARGIRESRRRTLEVVERRHAGGVGATSTLDVHLARENLAGAEAQVAPLEREVALARHALLELVGLPPHAELPLSLASPLPPIAPPPPGLPVALLDARPDLRSARSRLEAAAANVDVALAGLYPDLVLSATGGWTAQEFADLFDAERLFAGILGQLGQTLFAGGRLEAEVEASRARLSALSESYAAAVLRAVREVEDALVREARAWDELGHIERQASEARRAEELALDRYRRGLEPLLTVLETERRRATVEDAALRLQGSLWSARVELHLALGGTWMDNADGTAEDAGDE